MERREQRERTKIICDFVTESLTENGLTFGPIRDAVKAGNGSLSYRDKIPGLGEKMDQEGWTPFNVRNALAPERFHKKWRDPVTKTMPYFEVFDPPSPAPNERPVENIKIPSVPPALSSYSFLDSHNSSYEEEETSKASWYRLVKKKKDRNVHDEGGNAPSDSRSEIFRNPDSVPPLESQLSTPHSTARKRLYEEDRCQLSASTPTGSRKKARTDSPPKTPIDTLRENITQLSVTKSMKPIHEDPVEDLSAGRGHMVDNLVNNEGKSGELFAAIAAHKGIDEIVHALDLIKEGESDNSLKNTEESVSSQTKHFTEWKNEREGVIASVDSELAKLPKAGADTESQAEDRKAKALAAITREKELAVSKETAHSKVVVQESKTEIQEAEAEFEREVQEATAKKSRKVAEINRKLYEAEARCMRNIEAAEAQAKKLAASQEKECDAFKSRVIADLEDTRMKAVSKREGVVAEIKKRTATHDQDILWKRCYAKTARTGLKGLRLLVEANKKHSNTELRDKLLARSQEYQSALYKMQDAYKSKDTARMRKDILDWAPGSENI